MKIRECKTYWIQVRLTFVSREEERRDNWREDGRRVGERLYKKVSEDGGSNDWVAHTMSGQSCPVSATALATAQKRNLSSLCTCKQQPAFGGWVTFIYAHGAVVCITVTWSKNNTQNQLTRDNLFSNNIFSPTLRHMTSIGAVTVTKKSADSFSSFFSSLLLSELYLFPLACIGWKNPKVKSLIIHHVKIFKKTLSKTRRLKAPTRTSVN